jgi:phage shock protein A
MNAQEMSLEELRGAYTILEKRYESLGKATRKYEDEILSLKSKNAILNAQKVQWDAQKDIQNGIVQGHVSKKDEEIQALSVIIEELRSQIKDLKCQYQSHGEQG